MQFRAMGWMHLTLHNNFQLVIRTPNDDNMFILKRPAFSTKGLYWHQFGFTVLNTRIHRGIPSPLRNFSKLFSSFYMPMSTMSHSQWPTQWLKNAVEKKRRALRLAKQALRLLLVCLSRKSLTSLWMGESHCERDHGLKTCLCFFFRWFWPHAADEQESVFFLLRF